MPKKEILQRVVDFLSENKFHQIATVNPEFILQAQKDEKFKNILNSCDLNIADGTGIWFALLRYGKFLKTRMAGADLMEEILSLASSNNHPIFLVTNNKSLSTWEETRAAILKKYPRLTIGGSNINNNSSYLPTGQAGELLVTSYNIVFCSFGAPDQEIFIDSLKTLKDSKIKLAMGVGGSFDFLTGKIKRAPGCIRKAGLEWLWRFLQEPTYRAKRIFNATIVFPIKIIFNK